MYYAFVGNNFCGNYSFFFISERFFVKFPCASTALLAITRWSAVGVVKEISTKEGFKQRALYEIETGKLPVVNRQDKRNKIRQFVKTGFQTKEKYFKDAYKSFFYVR